ncbi:MAG: sulfite exporter TauE/SafE family protein [Candidatus Pacebacteria bacterium]|nr:sulfite exporter TauE/SafE family protein [Candidatus Paceibacterota bacterium]
MNLQQKQKLEYWDIIKYGIDSIGKESKISDIEEVFKGKTKVVNDLDDVEVWAFNHAYLGQEHLTLSFEQDNLYGFIDFDLMPNHNSLRLEAQTKRLVNFKAQVFTKRESFDLISLNAATYLNLKKQYGLPNNFDKFDGEKEKELIKVDQLLREQYKSFGVNPKELNIWHIEKLGNYYIPISYYFKGNRDLLFPTKQGQSYLSFAVSEVCKSNKDEVGRAYEEMINSNLAVKSSRATLDKEEEEVKSEKRKLKKEDIIGFVLGTSLAWAVGFTGIIPYVLGTIFGIWVARKMLGSDKLYIKIVFWVLFILIFIGGAINHGIRSESGYPSSLKTEDISLLKTDKSAENSEVSGNMYRNTKYHFRIKFPEGWKIGIGDGIHIVQKASYENSTISVIVQQFDLGGGEGLSSIKDVGTLREVIDIAVDSMETKFSDVKIINQGETKIDNQPAYWVEISAMSQVLDYKLKMTSLIYLLAKEDILYSISAGTDSEEYEQIKPKFYQTVSTFVLEN